MPIDDDDVTAGTGKAVCDERTRDAATDDRGVTRLAALEGRVGGNQAVPDRPERHSGAQVHRSRPASLD